VCVCVCVWYGCVSVCVCKSLLSACCCSPEKSTQRSERELSLTHTHTHTHTCLQSFWTNRVSQIPKLSQHTNHHTTVSAKLLDQPSLTDTKMIPQHESNILLQYSHRA